jgi:hypothetical protein
VPLAASLRVFIISDDNTNPTQQRTLLYEFSLPTRAIPQPPHVDPGAHSGQRTVELLDRPSEAAALALLLLLLLWMLSHAAVRFARALSPVRRVRVRTMDGVALVAQLSGGMSSSKIEDVAAPAAATFVEHGAAPTILRTAPLEEVAKEESVRSHDPLPKAGGDGLPDHRLQVQAQTQEDGGDKNGSSSGHGPPAG